MSQIAANNPIAGSATVNYYRRYVADYLSKTSRLSILEHGAYCMLLDYYYADERPLPLDMEETYRLVRAMRPDEKKAVDRVLRDFFECRDDGWHNVRADEELSIAATVIETAKENGRLGGRPRKNPEETQTITQVVTRGITQTQTQTEPATKPANNHPLNHSTTQPPIPSTPQPRRGSRLPADWRLSTEQIEWAVGAQPTWDAEHALKVAEAFRDYWIAQSGQRGVKADWDATWRNWVRKEGPRSTQRSGADSWWLSDAGILRKGREVGLEARAGESMASFRDRIRGRLEAH